MVRKGDRIKTYDRGFPVGFKASFDTVRLFPLLFGLTSIWSFYNCLYVCTYLHSDFVFLQKNKDEKFFIFNHLSFVVSYHDDAETTDARIVGFEVTPFRSVT